MPRTSRKHRSQRQQFIKGGSQRIQVGPLIDEYALPGDLLWTGVQDRPQQLASTRQVLFIVEVSQPEVRDPEMTLFVDQTGSPA